MLPIELLAGVATFAAFQVVLGAPSTLYYVELMSCGASASINSTTSQCGSICDPVLQAQLLCNGLPYCTCTTAPVDVIRACLQCHIQESSREYAGDYWIEIPPRVQSYATMCDDVLVTRSKTPLPGLIKPESPANETLTRREASVCVYGLPDVTFLPPSYLPSYRSPWLLFSFVVVAVISVSRVRRRDSPLQS